jgi:hypothetical protein
VEHDGYAWRSGRPIHRRTLTLSDRSLEVLDQVVGAREPFASRLRVDAAMEGLLSIDPEGGRPTKSLDAWYPRHGEARDARLFVQHGEGDERLRWRIGW